jgi:hypothetical protein
MIQTGTKMAKEITVLPFFPNLESKESCRGAKQHNDVIDY